VRDIPFAIIDPDTQQAIATCLYGFMLLRGVRSEPATIMAALQSLNPRITWDATKKLLRMPPTFSHDLQAWLLLHSHTRFKVDPILN
jgi:hypothetical protein